MYQPGSLGDDTLGMALILSSDPEKVMYWSLSLMTGCGLGTSLCTLEKVSVVFLVGWLVITACGIC